MILKWRNNSNPKGLFLAFIFFGLMTQRKTDNVILWYTYHVIGESSNIVCNYYLIIIVAALEINNRWNPGPSTQFIHFHSGWICFPSFRRTSLSYGRKARKGCIFYWCYFYTILFICFIYQGLKRVVFKEIWKNF